MSSSARPIRNLLLIGALLALAGCLPQPRSQLDEEREPHFLAGKSRVNQMDYPGAIECFERALEVNPRSASAHFELALLYEQKRQDPAAAIFHFDRFLQFRPRSDYADVVKQRVLACKQELAKTVSLGPVTQSLQSDFERLSEENRRLREEVEKWRVYYQKADGRVQRSETTPVQEVRGESSVTRPQAPDSKGQKVPSKTQSSPQLVATKGTSVGLANSAAAPRNEFSSAANRMHTVKAGETLTGIAKKYGLRLETLVAANPKLDANRLRIGQPLSVPAPLLSRVD